MITTIGRKAKACSNGRSTPRACAWAPSTMRSLLEVIQHLNRADAWPLTILPPRFGDVVVDRGRRTISAVCLWKRKPSNDSKEV